MVSGWMFSDIDWTKRGHHNQCFSNSEKVKDFEKNQLEHWSLLGPVQEEKWYGRHNLHT